LSALRADHDSKGCRSSRGQGPPEAQGSLSRIDGPLSWFSGQRPDPVEHFLIVREATGVVLTPYRLAIHVHIENAAGALDETGINVEGLLDGGRQTGGLGEIVSLRAILDGDGHEFRSFQSCDPCCTHIKPGPPGGPDAIIARLSGSVTGWADTFWNPQGNAGGEARSGPAHRHWEAVPHEGGRRIASIGAQVAPAFFPQDNPCMI
jgi:hypothetical protein